MRDTTKKLSGPQKVRFLERLYASHEGISESAAASLTRRTADAVSSLQVRTKAYEAIRKAKPAHRPEGAEGRAAPAPVQTVASPAVQEVPLASAPAACDALPAATPQSQPFDPYAFGLVPIYQKEGREALLARLTDVASADHLRQIARAQQVSLPQDLRAGDATLDALRTAILDAVAKRIADRKAAAG